MLLKFGSYAVTSQKHAVKKIPLNHFQGGVPPLHPISKCRSCGRQPLKLHHVKFELIHPTESELLTPMPIHVLCRFEKVVWGVGLQHAL